MSDWLRHFKWTALLIWLALLGAMLFTSYVALSAATASGLLSSFFVSLFRFETLSQPGEEQNEESTLFSDWLIFRPRADESAAEEPDLDEAEQTLVSAVLRYLAFAWIVILISPPVVMLVNILLANG
ncbi:MAG: hypothetical protein ACPL7C_09180 [Anaerolineae bacterium]|jgi:hypothetical protein